jgi:hypothetical protein
MLILCWIPSSSVRSNGHLLVDVGLSLSLGMNMGSLRLSLSLRHSLRLRLSLHTRGVLLGVYGL